VESRSNSTTFPMLKRYERPMLKLDRYDIDILRILSRDGRITKSRLSELVHLSVSPAWERVRRLEEGGIIRGYRAELDWTGSVNISHIIVEITLGRHTAHDLHRFETRMCESPEVVQCYATGGGIDYVVHTVTRDINEYQRFIDAILMDNLGVERYFTYVVTKMVKPPTSTVPDWIFSE
jgi:Lrp/AsnC family transcriptional regulator, regulator of ectoine-degradation genes